MREFTSKDFEKAKVNSGASEQLHRPSLSFLRETVLRLRRDPTVIICSLLLLIIVLGAIFIPMVMPVDYAQQNVIFANKPPMTVNTNNFTHIFGTDVLGRDIFTRVWYGARISLTVAVAVALIDCFIGIIYGGISGYLGGNADNIMMRILEVINGIPYLIIVLLLVAVLPRGIITLIVAYSIAGWTGMARLVRSQVISLKEMEFIQAAKIMGASPKQIIFKHLIPNILGVIIVNITLDIPAVIFTEAFLSLLGLGIAPPFPSLGVMASEGSTVFQTYPYQLAVPAIFICIIMLAFNLLGDHIQDALDPKQRRMLRGKGIKNRKSKHLL